jgi:cell division protein FtsI/penicillin-binding protein 2
MFETDEGPIHVTTTIDADLQNYLTQQLMLKTSAHIGIVVLNAFNGEVLAMVSHDRQDPDANTCLNSQFPAASIFKIVAAAAAMERADLDPTSPLSFSGGKHTLYKSQITQKTGRHTKTTNLKKAFASSINPIFGKLGAFTLTQTTLLDFAHRFGFQQPIDFILPLKPSAFIITDRPYQWAELASGFNKTTTLSPLQGALIAAATVNEGQWVSPRLIYKVTNGKEKVRYQMRPFQADVIVTPQTARHLRTVMQATIINGTGRKAFRGWKSDPVLSNLELGGKTGGYGTNPRYDWFVGYGMDTKRNHAIAVSVLVGHQDLIGTRAGQYARKALKYYFERQSAFSK